MKINDLLRERRLQLGVSSADIARRSGLSISAYEDLEQHADEFESALSLETARRVCRVLDLSLVSLLVNRLGKMDEQDRAQSRSDIIREARRKQGLSEHQLAESLGFEEVVVANMERDANFLESWPIQMVAELAVALKLDLHLLLRPDANRYADD